MTQVLFYRSPAGIAIAVDSRAVSYPTQAEIQYQTIQKIFVLTRHVVLVTAGAGYGVLLSGKFQAHVARHPWWDFQEIKRHALPFLRAEIDHLQKTAAQPLSHADFERVYFVLAGFVPQQAADPFQMELLGSEHDSDLLHTIQTGPVLAVPRRVGMEYQLNNLSVAGKGLDEAEELSEGYLLKLAVPDNDRIIISC